MPAEKQRTNLNPIRWNAELLGKNCLKQTIYARIVGLNDVPDNG